MTSYGKQAAQDYDQGALDQMANHAEMIVRVAPNVSMRNPTFARDAADLVAFEELARAIRNVQAIAGRDE